MWPAEHRSAESHHYTGGCETDAGGAEVGEAPVWSPSDAAAYHPMSGSAFHGPGCQVQPQVASSVAATSAAATAAASADPLGHHHHHHSYYYHNNNYYYYYGGGGGGGGGTCAYSGDAGYAASTHDPSQDSAATAQGRAGDDDAAGGAYVTGLVRRKILISRLHERAQHGDVRGLLARCPGVAKVQFRPADARRGSKCHALVTFVSHDAAAAALLRIDGKTLHGRPVAARFTVELQRPHHHHHQEDPAAVPQPHAAPAAASSRATVHASGVEQQPMVVDSSLW